MAQEYGSAQPIIDWGRKYGLFPKKPKAETSGSSTDSGKLPDAWEEANRKAVAAQLKGETPKLSQRKNLGQRKKAAKKSTAKKKPAKRG